MKQRIFLLLILVFSFIFFIPSLNLFFASDDFYYLSFKKITDFIQSEKLADLIERGTKVFLYQQSQQTVKLL